MKGQGEYIVNITRTGVKGQGEYIVHFTRNGCEEAGDDWLITDRSRELLQEYLRDNQSDVSDTQSLNVTGSETTNSERIRII